MKKKQIEQVIAPRDLDGLAVMAVIETEKMSKQKGEYDTEFVKRIVCAYMNACGLLGRKAIDGMPKLGKW